ncbi:MAG: WXG100 family type VII secretion target [Chloroflexaceae bacterium]|nr:WXG100 family type VII secretion target [Chloroflexaceae bacterium]
MGADIVQAHYEELDAVAARFAQQTEAINALSSRVRVGFQALENGGWEGRGWAAFAAEMDRLVFPKVQALIHALEEGRAVTLEAKEIIQRAEEEAAALFGNEGGQIIGKGGEGGGEGKGEKQGTAKTIHDMFETGTQLYGLGKAFWDSHDLWKLHSQLFGHLKEFQAGNYDNYADFLKKVNKFPVDAVKLDYRALAKSEALDSFKNPLGLALTIADVGLTGWENWEENEGLETGDRIRKTAVSTAIDSTLSIGLSTGGTYLGALGGGALGGAIGGPLGAAIGAKVGGFLGGLAGQWAAKKIQEDPAYGNFVNWADKKVEQGIEQGVDNVGGFARNMANKADGTLDSFARGVSNLFGG